MSKCKFTIDRFEGNYAVCELNNGKMVDVSKDIIPLEAKEGDIIQLNILEQETIDETTRIKNKFQHLWE